MCHWGGGVIKLLTETRGKFMDKEKNHIKSLPKPLTEMNQCEHVTQKCTALYEIVFSKKEMKIL